MARTSASAASSKPSKKSPGKKGAASVASKKGNAKGSSAAAAKSKAKKGGFVLCHRGKKGIIANGNDEGAVLDAVLKFEGGCEMKKFEKKKDALAFLKMQVETESKKEECQEDEASVSSASSVDKKKRKSRPAAVKENDNCMTDSSDDEDTPQKATKKSHRAPPLSPSMLDRIKNSTQSDGLQIRVFEPSVEGSKRIVFTLHFGKGSMDAKLPVFWCWKAGDFLEHINLIRAEMKDKTHSKLMDSLKVIDLRDQRQGENKARIQTGKDGTKHSIKILAGVVNKSVAGKMFSSPRDELKHFSHMVMKHFQSKLYQDVVENMWSDKLVNAVKNPRSGKNFFQLLSEATVHFCEEEHLDSVMVDDDCVQHAKKAFGSEMTKKGWSDEMKQFAFKDGQMPSEQE